jgi:lyso-ornithine lipid O-acyltransferase
MDPTPDLEPVRLAEEAQSSTDAYACGGNSNSAPRPLRGALYLLRVAYVLGGIIVVTFALYPWLAASFLLRYRTGQRLIPKTYHRIMRGLLGLNIAVQGLPSSCRPLCVVSNHTSWLDVVVISSFLPVVFVAKQEVASWPFFGWLAQLQRSIFVDRYRRHQVHQTIDRIADALVTGEIIGIFPEGTSTDGMDVVPFRSALIGAVHAALRREPHMSAIFVQPVSVTYVGANRRSAVWALEDEIPFFSHLLRVANMRRINVAVTWGEPVPADMNSDRKALTKGLEQTVRAMVADAHQSRGFVALTPVSIGRANMPVAYLSALPSALISPPLHPPRLYGAWRRSELPPRVVQHRPPRLRARVLPATLSLAAFVRLWCNPRLPQRIGRERRGLRACCRAGKDRQ